MKKTTIQTSLLNKRVEMVNTYPKWGKGDQGHIASVWVDDEGHPMYTISLDKGQLINTWDWAFRLI
jgi:hypothetical protein